MKRSNLATHGALILLPLLLAVTAAPRLVAQQKPLERTLLWEISGNGLPRPSYLYGTMHVQDKRAFDFSDSVLLTFSSCSIFASEIELDSAMRKTFALFMRERQEDATTTDDAADIAIDEEAEPLVTPDTTIGGISMTDDSAATPVDISRETSRRRMRGATNPFSGDFFSSSSTPHPDDSPVVLDAYLYRLAKHAGMKVVGLEQVEEQLDAFQEISFSDMWQFYVKGGKKSKKRPIPTDPEEVQEMILKFYHKGDLTGINTYFVENWPPAYYKALLTNRNHHMADRAVKYMEEGGTFIAVGAGHLPGEEGLIELFRRKGYTVRPVKAARTGRAASYVEGSVRPAWHTLSPPEGAFAVDMPAEPIDVSELADSDEDARQVSQRSRSFVWPDLGSGITYAIAYTDYPHGSFLLRNFQGASSWTPSSRLLYDEKGFFDALDNGTPVTAPGRDSGSYAIVSGDLSGREILGDLGGGSLRRTRFFLRNNRLYRLSVQGPGDLVHSADADTFFGSFHPLEPIRSQWREYAADGFGFSVQVPATPRVMLDTQLLSATDINAAFIAWDTNNGQAYGVARSRYSEYFEAADIDTFFHDAVDRMKRYGDSIVVMRTIMQDGFPGRDLEIVHTGGRYGARIRVVLKGDQLYTLGMEGSTDKLRTDDANTFFESFRLTDTIVSGDLFASKIDHIFEDIASEDTSTRAAAVSGLGRYEGLKQEHLPRLYALIEQSYPDDGQEYGGTRMELIERLSDISDSTTVPFLRRLAPSIADLPNLRSTVLSTLTIIKGPAALTYLNELIADSANVGLLSRHFFYPFVDDTASLRLLFPSVLPLIDREDQRFMIQMLIVTALDSGIIDPAVVASSTSSIVSDLRAALDTRRSKDIDEEEAQDNSYRIWSDVKCLGRLPATPEIDLLLMEALSDSDQEVKIAVTVALIRHNRPVPDPTLRKMAADPAKRIELYRELEQAGRLDRFPRQYMSQKDIAEGLLAEWLVMEYYDDSPDSLRVIGEREVTVGGEQGRVYLFAFHYGEQGESWRVGISGLQPLDREKIASTGMRVMSLDGKLEDMSIDAHFDALLNQKPEGGEE